MTLGLVTQPGRPQPMSSFIDLTARGSCTLRPRPAGVPVIATIVPTRRSTQVSTATALRTE